MEETKKTAKTAQTVETVTLNEVEKGFNSVFVTKNTSYYVAMCLLSFFEYACLDLQDDPVFAEHYNIIYQHLLDELDIDLPDIFDVVGEFLVYKCVPAAN